MLSIFKRTTAAAPAGAGGSEPADGVLLARRRARQRLIGASVLVMIGVIGFPLVFETQPRPIPVDIPIEIPRKEGASALVMPAPRPMAVPSAPSSLPSKAARGEVTMPTTVEAPREPAAAPSAPAPGAAAERVAPKPPTKPATAEPVVAPPKPAAAPAKPPNASTAEAARAKALLEGGDAAKSEAGRFVVQVGAFAEAGAARATRLKAEKLGLKTYTQVAETAAGSRIRVRVGPFATRDEADKVLAKAKAAGLNAVVLTL
jgi:DedD protein